VKTSFSLLQSSSLSGFLFSPNKYLRLLHGYMDGLHYFINNIKYLLFLHPAYGWEGADIVIGPLLLGIT
jgi:hypothetical protein